MTNPIDDDTLEITDEQIAALRDLGAMETRLDELTFLEAEELIAELRALRQDAGRVGAD